MAAVTAALLSSRATAEAVLTKNQLVYAFSYSSVQDVYARDSKNPAEPIDLADRLGSGISHYHAALNDRGTMTVQIGRQESDGGLIVAISEQGESTRRALPATCVVFGDTRTICDPDKTVNPEEYTLLRFLARNFVDPTRLDANRSWTVTQNSRTLDEQAKYQINSVSNGIMQIAENRRVRPVSGGSQTTEVQTKISYDFSRSIPTSVDEYVTQRLDNGMGSTTTTVYQTTLTLEQSPLTAETAQ
ncbi:MAG TPA: hypothetical protein VKR56_10430 [Candidatus Cybelea sp.]|nr:hypothetical protein [Candidatus Cybelea sp.]